MVKGSRAEILRTVCRPGVVAVALVCLALIVVQQSRSTSRFFCAYRDSDRHVSEKKLEIQTAKLRMKTHKPRELRKSLLGKSSSNYPPKT